HSLGSLAYQPLPL
ncbi:hypothetical protein D043_3730B, partial [Vibrio parahaemolyticus EKP-021]